MSVLTKKPKAISLLSGGLDSVLATKIVMEQGVEVIALHFTSPFCTCSRGKKGCGIQALRSARELKIEVIVREKGMDYMKIVERPKFGYGSNMNPCIDCRIYMLKRAKELMDETGASFVVTGEVLNQRPMSQNRNALRLIEKEAGLEGRVLRPLSAKFLPPTIPEIEGLVKREKLLSIKGRGRKAQYELVRQYGINEFACPAGGCLLTDPAFSKRVRDMFLFQKDYTMLDVLLLKLGRHLRFDDTLKIIVARNRLENEKLERFKGPLYTLLSPADFNGPNVLIVGPKTERSLKIGVSVMAWYAKNHNRFIKVRIKGTVEETALIERSDFDVNSHLI
ncbi:MAG: hypothetical protein QXJ58_05085 [Archaeoglobaceae archaeon]